VYPHLFHTRHQPHSRHIEQAQQIFQSDLDSDTKLQLAAVALQALDWRCKHLTERLRACLLALSLSGSKAPSILNIDAAASPRPVSHHDSRSFERSRRVQDSVSPAATPRKNSSDSFRGSSSGFPPEFTFDATCST
jgi:hypothetical protein